MSAPIVTRFLRAVRRRLWFESMLRQLPVAIRAASGTLLLVAIVHYFWSPADTRDALAVASIVGLIVLLPGLLRRPRLEECAQRADRQFDGYSLLTTAHEFASGTPSRPAEMTVITRAANAAERWRPRLGSIWHSPRGSAFILAIVPAFFALLILELPARGNSDIDMNGGRSGVNGVEEVASGLFEDTGILPEVRDAIVRGKSEDPAVASSDGGAAETPVPSTALLNAVATERAEVNASADLPPGTARAVNEAGRDAGDARRNPGQYEQHDSESGAAFSGRVETQIERQGELVTSGGEGDTEFDDRARGWRVANVTITPVPAPPAASAWTSLTAAEVAYARRYLEARGLSDE